MTLCDHMTAACQASLSFTISQSLLKLMSIDSVMLSNHIILDPDAGKDWRQKKSSAKDEMLVIYAKNETEFH